MAKLEFPKPLKQLLEHSDFDAPIRMLADRVGEILADNKLPFFPDYTDHGVDHVSRVLNSEVELVPKLVWENSKVDSEPRLLCDADAAIIVGATLLHDIAMHLRPEGFRELISTESRFCPIPWFKENRDGKPGDRPWHDQWEDYVREARRFSGQDLAVIIGEDSARHWKFCNLPADHGQWQRNHNLIVGEFLRRHHARLAHEIAIYGFPGVPVGSGEGQFPAMGKEDGHSLMRLADLIGLTARSHGTTLRTCAAYLAASALYPGTPRPMGTAVLFPMALLRVADYLQIDRSRAPAVLLQLRKPQSPVSLLEWKKHRAVQHIGSATDPRGKMITISSDLSLTLYLQLQDLLEGLQVEMDHSTAVLDEAYGTLTELGLNQLNLAARRVYSNLQSPVFQNSLPYVPSRSGFSTDPDLLALLVEPLYGKEPVVGIRELMQNAADAVCELNEWCNVHGQPVESLDLPKLDHDVTIEFVERENHTWFLRVTDKGIGMKHGTIQDYFLRAGASFRRSAEWSREFLDDNGQPRVTRAGRFGIGAFAMFLLGSSFKLWTRHVETSADGGYSLEAAMGAPLIEIKRQSGLSIGTTVEVELYNHAVDSLRLVDSGRFDGSQQIWPKSDWFCWDWPIVHQQIVRGASIERIPQRYRAPIRRGSLFPEWFTIYPDNFGAVFWTFADAPSLSCNGLQICGPAGHCHFNKSVEWPLNIGISLPSIAVVDNEACLPLTIQRYGLSYGEVGFVSDLLRDVALSLIAHALVCGPVKPISLQPGGPCCGHHPLSELDWCSTQTEFSLSDPWLYSLLGKRSCFVYGAVDFHDRAGSHHGPISSTTAVNAAIFCLDERFEKWVSRHGLSELQTSEFLDTLCRLGVPAIGHSVLGARVLVSTAKDRNLPQVSECEPPIGVPKWSDGIHDRWTKLGPTGSYFRWEIRVGCATNHLPIDTILAELEERDADFLKTAEWKSEERCLYVAEIINGLPVVKPDSLIASVWMECLGPRAIPFDTNARFEMIEDVRRHKDMRHHIEAWEEMRRTGSKWAMETSWDQRRSRSRS